MKKFLGEFKAFAMKGNVVDMAVGVVIGGAFGTIVTSLVNDIIMPLVAIPTGKVNFATLNATVDKTVITYGAFIQSIVDFLIIAFSIFMVIKLMSKLEKKKEEVPAAPPEPSEEIKLLTEIRDALNKQ